MSNKYDVQLRNSPAVKVEADRFEIEDGNYVFYVEKERIAAFNCAAVEYVGRRTEEAAR